MSRKVINVVGSKNQFAMLNLSSVYPKLVQLSNESESEIELTEEEVLQIYGVESLSEINNVNFALAFFSAETDNPGLMMSQSLVINNIIIYNSSVFDPEQSLTYFRVYNFFQLSTEAGEFTSINLIIAILKDGVEETDDIKTHFILQKA